MARSDAEGCTEGALSGKLTHRNLEPLDVVRRSGVSDECTKSKRIVGSCLRI